MCAPDRCRAGGRSTALYHATLLPGRTPRGGGRRYRRRDGVCRFGGRRRRVSAHMRAISSHAGRHFSSPLHFRAQRLTHPNPSEGGRVAIEVVPQPPPPPPPPPPPVRRKRGGGRRASCPPRRSNDGEHVPGGGGGGPPP